MMRKTFAYFSASVLMIGLAVMFSLPRVAPAVKADGEGDPLEGTWRVTVTGEDGYSFQALFTFARGGVMMETDETQLTRPIGTNGQGVWTRTGDQYAFVWENFLFDPYQNFAPVGKLKLHGTITLTGSDSYTSADQFDYFDTSGNAMFSGRDSGVATRMTVEVVPTPTPTPTLDESGAAESRSTQSRSLIRGWKPYLPSTNSIPSRDKQ